MASETLPRPALFWPPLERRLRWVLAAMVPVACAAWYLLWGLRLPPLNVTGGTALTIAASIIVFGTSIFNTYIKPLGPRHAAWLIYANRVAPDPESLLEVLRDIFGKDN